MQITWDKYRSICSAIKCLLEISADDHFVTSNVAVYDAIQAAYIVLRILGYLRISCLPNAIILPASVCLHICLLCSCDCMCERTTHARIQEFLPGGSRPDCQKTVLTCFLVLNLFYSFTEGVQWLFQRKL